MTSLFELVNKLGVRAVGRTPRWTTQENTTGAPSSASAGVNIRDAVKTLIHVALREETHRKTARIAVVYDADTVYRVSVDENDVDTDTDSGTIADLDALLAQIADNVNADATVGDLVTASVEDGQVVLRGDTEADYDLAVSIVSGSGTIEIASQDADTASARVYLRAGGQGDRPGRWVRGEGVEFEAISYRGLAERISTAGYDRAYVEIFDVAPSGATVSVALGPGVME